MRSWLDSATVRHLGAAIVLNILTWTLLSLGTNVWDWRALAASSISILIPFVRRVAQPDLQTGVPMLDRSNPK